MAELDLFSTASSDASDNSTNDTPNEDAPNDASGNDSASRSTSNGHTPSRASVQTVTELAQRLQSAVETTVGTVTVEGELSNFKRAASGHCYFSIKDEEAQLRCVMWRYQTKNIYFSPKDGQQVRLTGKATVYPKRGQLQLMATRLERAGRGAKQAEYERLKRTLKAEGLFDDERKQPLPPFPRMVGVITSGEGAAIEDIRSVLARRYPLADVVLCPVPVQGIDAPAALTNAINAFSGLDADHPQRPDVLIIGRGGGSAEDLWAFNEEPVARALAACTVPTISAVGHETDTSITDFVADRTAATPSMAAEIAVPDQQALRTQVRALHEQMRGPLARRIRRYRQTVERLQNTRALHSPRYQVEQHRQHLDHIVERLDRAMRARADRLRTRVQTAQQRLRSADPQRPMQHGFALVTQQGEPVTRAADLDPDVPVALRFRDGTRQATVHAPSDAPADSE